MVGEPRPRPEPTERKDVRPNVQLSRFRSQSPQHFPKRPALGLRSGLQDVEPESYDVRERSPVRSSSSGIVRPSSVPPSSAPLQEGAATGAPFVLGAPVQDQAPIAPKRTAPSEGAAPGASEEQRGSVRRFLSPEAPSERPATKEALGAPPDELDQAVPPPPPVEVEVAHPPPVLPPPPPVPAPPVDPNKAIPPNYKAPQFKPCAVLPKRAEALFATAATGDPQGSPDVKEGVPQKAACDRTTA